MSRARKPTLVMPMLVFVLALMSVGAAVTGCDRSSSTAPAGSLSTVAIQADYPFYSDADELVDAADAVVIGVVAEAESRQVDVGLEGESAGEPYLVSRVKVEQAIKGSVKAGDAIEVKQLLSADSPQRIWLDREGMRALLFLVEFPGLPCSPLNPMQAVVLIEGGKTRAAPGSSPFGTPRSEEELVSELRSLVN